MMNCLCVVAPTDEDLLRYALDGEILPTVAEEHLGYCLICQQRLARYVSANNFLARNLYRSQCPDITTLLQYCHGLLAANDELALSEHLNICPLCASDVVETRQLISSSALLSDTRSFFLSLPHIERISVVPYRNARTPISPEKSAAGREYGASIWPMKYQANTTELLLQVTYNNHDGITLSGTLLSLYPDETSGNIPTFVGVKAELYCSIALTGIEECSACTIDHPLGYLEEPLFTVLVDEPGRINFPSVPPGTYLLIVYLPDTAMVIEELCIIGRDQTRPNYGIGG